MKHLYCLWLLLLLHGAAFAQVNDNDTTQCEPKSLRLHFRSYETNQINGLLILQLDVAARAEQAQFEVVSASSSATQFAQASPDNTASRSLQPNQTMMAELRVNYTPSQLPYYPVRITTVLRTVQDGISSLMSHDCYVYFTPYGTAEVWDIVDFGRLRRSWLVGNEATAPSRINIAKSAIPVSNIGATEELGPQDYVGMRFVPGLAYAIPMRYTSATNSENDPPSDTQARDGCGFGSRRYRGRIENVRLFTMHVRDGDRAMVPIALKNARVRIMRNVDVGPDITIKEVYTDDEGFVTQYGSRTVEFDHCSINTNSVRVYLSIELIDQPEKVRVKRVGAWYSWTRIATGTQTLDYNNSNRQTLNFGTAIGGNREISLDPNDAGRTFTWVKWSKQLLQQELGSAVSLSTTLAIKIKDAGEGASYNRFSHNMFIPLDRLFSERTNMHEFGHYAMHEMQGGNWQAETGGEHFSTRNNKHPNTTITEGFANGFAYIMDEMTWSVLDQESGFNEANNSIHGLWQTRLYPAAIFTNLPRDLDLNHAFVSEEIFARILLDLWDGPVNYALFGNSNAANQYGDFGNDTFEMSLADVFRPLYTSLIPDPVRYYNRLLSTNTVANADRNVQMRDLWHYNFSSSDYNVADFTILGTDELSGARTFTHDRDDYNWLTKNFSGTSNYSYTYIGTDVSALNGLGSSYNLTTYFDDSYNTAGQYLGRQTINASGAVLSDNLTVQNSASLYLHGSPQPCSYNQSPPSLHRYVKRTDNLNIDIAGQARLVLQQGSRAEAGSVSPFQTTTVSMRSGTLLSVEAGAELKINAGSTLNVWQGATLLVRNGGSVIIDGELLIRSGGYICVEEGGNVTLTSSSTLYVDAGAQMGAFPGLGLPATTCANKVSACGIVNIQNSGVANIGGGNEALLFDGDDVVTIPNTGSYVNDLGQQFAIEAYIRSTNPQASGPQTIFSNRRTNSAKTYGLEGALLTLYDGYLLLQLEGVNFGYGQTSMRIPTDGACHHVGVSRDATNLLRFFIDGKLVAYSPTTSRSPNAGGSLSLGASDPYGSGFGEYFAGMIGEVRIWNSSRSEDQIQQNLTTKLSAPQYGLVAYYDMQDVTGQQLADGAGGVSGHGYPLVPGILGASSANGADDPTWLSKCSLPCSVQGNLRTASADMTAKSKEFSRGSAADTMSQARSVMLTSSGEKSAARLASLHVTPNPASNTATLHFSQPTAGSVRVRILDLSGNPRAEALPATRLEAGNHEVSLPLRGLSPGLYLVTVESMKGREFIRLRVE